MRIAIPLLASLMVSASVFAADPALPKGAIILLDKCPGDDVVTKPRSGNEVGFLAALLTPLLSGAISHGIKAIGTRLQEEAQEAQVDALATGDYLYKKATDSELGLKYQCLVVVTQGTKKTDRALSELTSAYRPAQLTDDGTHRVITKFLDASGAELVKVLKTRGYADDREMAKPAMIVVFDIEVAEQGSNARLVTRFVVMDHSIRERANDNYARDMTFELAFTAPGSAAAFGKELIKFEGLKIASPRVRKALQVANPTEGESGGLLAVGQWFTLPDVDADLKARLTAAEEATSKQATEKMSSDFARAAALALKQDPSAVCPNSGPAVERWIAKSAELAVEMAKPEKQRDPKLVAGLTQLTTYYGACSRMGDAEKALKTKKLKDGESFMPFDVAVNVKEFRKRPVAKFFGDLLTDDDVRKGMTTAIMNEIDPGTRAAEAKKAADAKLALQGSYETAIFEAEKARAAYESAKVEEQATKYIEMEYKKRAANRIADQMKVPRPYPDAGVWFGG